MDGKIFGLDQLGIGAESDQMQLVLGIFRLNQPMQRQRHFLAGVQRIVHQHRITDVDQQGGLADRRILDAIHGKIFRRDPELLALFTSLQAR